MDEFIMNAEKPVERWKRLLPVETTESGAAYAQTKSMETVADQGGDLNLYGSATSFSLKGYKERLGSSRSARNDRYPTTRKSITPTRSPSRGLNHAGGHLRELGTAHGESRTTRFLHHQNSSQGSNKRGLDLCDRSSHYSRKLHTRCIRRGNFRLHQKPVRNGQYKGLANRYKCLFSHLASSSSSSSQTDKVRLTAGNQHVVIH